MNAAKNYYETLGVRPDASAEEIESAYERLAQELQPDVNAEPSDPERMREIDEAFDVLDDTDKRAEYDRTRSAAEATPPVWESRASVAAVTAAGEEVAIADADETSPTGEPAPAPPTSKGVDGALIGGIALLVGGIVALVAGIGVLAMTLTDDDKGVPEGFTETDSGLQYMDVVVGTGDTPQAGQTATVHYTGKLADGTEFDSSVGKVPLAFIVGADSLIPGFEEGVEGMAVGGQRTLIIPPELGYGEQGQGPIPANATIGFDVRLLAVSDPSPESPPTVTAPERELEGGVIAADIVEGTGDEAVGGTADAPGSLVAMHYTGWLQADGKRFDTSLGTDQSQPRVFAFTLGKGEAIKGWDIGVAGMKEGGRRRLVIPASLAYGETGQGDSIPPNATLIFDVELVEVAQ